MSKPDPTADVRASLRAANGKIATATAMVDVLTRQLRAIQDRGSEAAIDWLLDLRLELTRRVQ